MKFKNLLGKRKNLYSEGSLGFSLTDIMIVTAIISIIAGVATPNLKQVMQAYKLRMALTDLTSYMNMAKIRSAKQNRQWNIDLSPAGFTGYQLYYNDNQGNRKNVVSINFNACDDNEVYNKCYGGDVEYSSPDQSATCPVGELRFFPTGLTNICSVFVSNKKQSGYYRVDLLSASGIIQTQKWNGSGWE